MFALIACNKASSEMNFRQVDPDFGGLQGGKTVRVVGANLRLDIGYSVLFGNKISPRVSIDNDGALLAVTPRTRIPGPVDVVVRTDDGRVFRLEKSFQYVDQGGSLLDTADPDEADR